MSSFLRLGKCLEPVVQGTDTEVHRWSKGALLRPTGSEVTLPSSCIQRKVMLYPEPDNLTDPSFYVCIDYQRPHFPVSSVIVPVYPEVGDMILVKGDDPEPWRALVSFCSAKKQCCSSTLLCSPPTLG